MRVEQAVFTSLRTAARQGYQLAARSAGIGEQLAKQLRQWSPSHGSLLDQHFQSTSINCFASDADWIVASRTMYGAPEYSGRGALQVVTIILAAQRPQLHGFSDNPLVFARTALTLGYLRLPSAVPTSLPSVTLPDLALVSASSDNLPRSLAKGTLDKSVRLLNQGQRIALVATDPLAAVTDLLALIPPAARPETSFTTGLRPSRQRPFRVHVVPRIDAELQQRLSAQGIQLIAEKL